jgi:hypothetical protein
MEQIFGSCLREMRLRIQEEGKGSA